MNFMLVQTNLPQSIQDATFIAKKLLIHLASSPNFLSVIYTSFGTQFEPQKIAHLQHAWVTENFSELPPIEIRSRQELQGADGAFSKTTGKIYLAKEYLVQHENHPLAISNVLLEEIGHWVDSKINLEETPGDEGAIFSALVRGEILSEEQLLQLRAEDDSAITILDGEVVELEQAIVSVTPIIDNQLPEDDFLLYEGNSIPIDVSRFESPRLNALQAFDEKQDFTLLDPLVTSELNQWSQDSTIIPAGIMVDSHYIWLAPVQDPRLRVTAELTFNGDILGVIAWGDNLLATNDILGLNNVTYSPLETTRLDNNEEFPVVDDIINLIDSNTLEISLSNDSGLDSVRVITSSVDIPPTVTNPIADVTVDEDAVNTLIDLSTVFTDIDNDDTAITKVIAANSDSTLVNASLNENTLTLDYLENQSGTAEIIIEATSNTQTVTNTFTVNVNPVDDLPTVVNPIADVTVDEDAVNTLIDLSTVFTDIDNDDTAITKVIAANSDSTLVNASLNENTLTLDYLENQSGTAEIIIEATSNTQTVTDTFTVNVNPVDDLPTVVNPISDITVDEDAIDTIINLSTIFSDLDNINLSQSVTVNSNPLLVNATVNGDNLTLNYLENQSGTAEITVQAESNAEIVTDTFTVTVNSVDDLPTVANPIADITVDENAVDTLIDLSTVFSDIDNDDTAITQVVAANSDSTLVNASLNGNTLTLDYLENQSGTAEITIEATSNGLTVTDTFTINVNNVNPVDAPPTVANPIADITVDEDAVDSQIDLSTVFTDIDNDDTAITQVVAANSDSTLVNASLNGNTLTLDYLENQSGTAEIIIEATSNTQTVTDTFTVNVNPVDDPPTIVNPISDVTVDEDSDSITINLSDVFSDSDNNDADITKVFTNSDPSIIATSLEEEILTLDLQENQSGTVEISVEATSNSLTVTDTFTVNIAAVDDPPVVDSAIEDITVDQNTEETVIDLSNIFTDIDNNDAAITKVISVNSNSSLVAATVDENLLTLNYLEDQFGNTDITIEASSNGLTVTDTFSVTVNEVAVPTPTPDPIPAPDPLPSPSFPQEDQNLDTPDEDASEETPSETPVDNNGVSQPLFDPLPFIQATVTPLPTQSTLPDGSNDDNILIGTDNSELIDLGLGDDNVVAIAGDDYVLGGDGNDIVSANTGNDFVDGGTGNDTLYGGKDPDTIIGGAGEDSVFGNIGDDYLNTGEGNDWLNGNQGNDTIIGGDGDDQLYGGQDDDILIAESGNDIVNGDNGNDTLVGTRPNSSGAEIDTLEGGAGADLFVLGDAQQAYYTTAASNAIITDFNPSEDKIQLHGTFSDYEVVVDGDNVNLFLNTELIAVIEEVSSLLESDLIFG